MSQSVAILEKYSWFHSCSANERLKLPLAIAWGIILRDGTHLLQKGVFLLTLSASADGDAL
jgi:hypothetical protein